MMMNDLERFEVWAPEGGRWSLWAKPVLFHDIGPRDVPDVQMPPDGGAYRTAAEEPLAPAFAAIPAESSEALVVINLPGAASVRHALLAAAAGYRPVPLFAGCFRPSAAILQHGLREALIEATPHLEARRLPPDAPPAFLLDANRLGAAAPPPGVFDNRWCVFPQDFPSAGKLRHHGIRRAFVIQRDRRIDSDLATVLARWRDGGLTIALDHPDTGYTAPPDHLEAATESESPWHRSTLLSGLRPSPTGGFGAVVPQPSKG